jgi:hypothetical protein
MENFMTKKWTLFGIPLGKLGEPMARAMGRVTPEAVKEAMAPRLECRERVITLPLEAPDRVYYLSCIDQIPVCPDFSILAEVVVQEAEKVAKFHAVQRS